MSVTSQQMVIKMTAADEDRDQTDVTQPEDQSDEPEAPALARGTSVGRYLVAARIGKGGMGEVYQAFDPDLNRPVALKLLTVSKGKQNDSQQLELDRSRLLREAQALAQLAHPNVVTVFDVGTYANAVFVAMELIEGQTLKEWLGGAVRSRAEIMQVLRAAGEGLAAAHAVGIVHRDFKPANIIIGKDTRVRVLDFGLARAVDPAEAAASQEKSTVEPDLDLSESLSDSLAKRLATKSMESSGSLLSSSLTQVGSIVGTPNYMAAEQHLGRPVDERCDQFAFCVVLYEALYGQRPYQGKTFRELVENVTLGKITPLPEPDQIPSWIKNIILTGLTPDPDQRFPALRVLLEELDKDPEGARRQIRARRRRWVSIGAGVILVLFASAFGLWYGTTRAARLCQGAEDKLIGIWDDQVRLAMGKRFKSTQRPYAGDTFERVAKILDHKSAAWVAMHTEACEATRVHGTQSDKLLDLRMQCLEKRLVEMQALCELFVRQADEEMVDRAVQAALALSHLRPCTNTQALTEDFPLPDEPAVRSRIADLQRRLSKVTVLQRAGRYREGLAQASKLAQEASKIDYPPLPAQALFLLGSLQWHSGDAKTAAPTLKQAMIAAAVAKLDILRARAGSELVYVKGYQQARYELALEIGDLVLADVKRAGNKPALVAGLLRNLGVILVQQGNFDLALIKFTRALAQAKLALGPDHPDVAVAHMSLGNVLYSMRKLDEAGKHHERAREIFVHALGPGHPKVALSLINLGNISNKRGQTTQALTKYEQALAILSQAIGPEHPNVGRVTSNIGDVLVELGKFSEAWTYFFRAQNILEQALGSDHPDLARVWSKMGTVLCGKHQPAEARQYFERARVIFEKTFGPDHPSVAEALSDLGESWLATDQPARALPLLKRSLSSCESSPGNPVLAAETRFRLSRALWATKIDRDRALTLARQALDIYRAAGPAQAKARGRIEVWLVDNSNLR